jgi:hypothetical protein
LRHIWFCSLYRQEQKRQWTKLLYSFPNGHGPSARRW